MSARQIRLSIDGRRVEVGPGSTVLEAASKCGVHIPTLCHVQGLEPAASCFLCCVQVEGLRTLSPACALPAEEGMSVVTDSEDVRRSRRMALELLLSDHAGDCIAPCSAQCPAELDIPGFLYPLAAGRPGEAMEVLQRRLPLSGSLGRICPRLCEGHCRRSTHDAGLSIAELHRWVTDCNEEAQLPRGPRQGLATGRSVGIVGAGPAGLSAAYFLLQSGHGVILYDAHSEPGGMLRWAIPAYRLPRQALAREIEGIRRLGAEFKMGLHWGDDFSLDDLLERHDAVFLAIGAQASRRLQCEGDELAVGGVELLARVAGGEAVELGRRVVVTGGGNTAMDAARTAVRLGAEVRVVYRRTRAEMPCLLEEVEGAEEEDVSIDYLLAPLRLRETTAGELELVCQRMVLGEPDASGRRRPVPVAGAEQTYRCDSVVAATGQQVVLDVARREGLEVTGWGIAADPETLETSRPGVFAGGDAVLGSDLAVRAVAAGRRAAVAIDQRLSGAAVTGPHDSVNVALRPLDEDELAELFRDIDRRPRIATEQLDARMRRSTFEEIERGLDETAAMREAGRCLSCGCPAAEGCQVRSYATEYEVDPLRFLGARRRFARDESHPEIVYEPGKCILCDACVRIAAEAAEPLGIALIGRGFQVAMGVPFDRPLAEGLRETAARCAEACPTGALELRRRRACDLAGCGGDRLVTLGGGS